MDHITRPLRPGRAFLAALDRIRAGALNPRLGKPAQTLRAELETLAAPLLARAGLSTLTTLHYRWFLREISRLWSTQTGPDLAFHLELAVRKWTGLGLDPAILQALVCTISRRRKTAQTHGAA
uniref:Uncharacterized protein n=1 Tax=candidate division WOR-3 bacterium TaxID=2052148 RepID=A0A7C4CA46_UNCW3